MKVISLSGHDSSAWPLDELRSASVLFHTQPDHPSFHELSALGIHCQALDSGDLPTDATLVNPASLPLYELVHISDRLLGPGGCPWDQAQTHESLKRHMLEEVYELFEAIDIQSDVKMREELGDVLLQPIMHAQMKQRDRQFGIDDVAREIVDKLVRRHPHVFGEVVADDADEVLRNWDKIKKSEKGDAPRSILAGVPKAMPSLLRAYEVSKRAVRVGFEWPDIDAVFDKLREEEAELKGALASGDQEQVESELGDLLFTAVNIARWAKVEPEEALRKMLDRFTRRFMLMESLAEKPLDELSFEEWDALWERSKAHERAKGPSESGP